MPSGDTAVTVAASSDEAATITRTDSGPLTSAYETALSSPGAAGFLLAGERDAVGGRRAGTLVAEQVSDPARVTITGRQRRWGWCRWCCFAVEVRA